MNSSNIVKHAIIVLSVSCFGVCLCMGEMEFNALMMESTFRIEGPATRPGKKNVGTGFFIAKASTKRPGTFTKVLLTAYHVLDEIAGENATLVFRKTDILGTWTREDLSIRIRSGRTNLWVQHPKFDLAAIVLSVPDHAFRELGGPDRIITEQEIKLWELHPGDQLYCLGYPLGLEGNVAGFPILRQGTIASYPLTPVKHYPTFLFAFDVFGGNSGGPVYLVQVGRWYAGAVRLPEQIHGIMGMVVRNITHAEYTETLGEKRISETSLVLSEVIKGDFLKEVLQLVPDP